MTISKSNENGSIIIKVEGRLDTNTALDFEKEINSITGTESIIIDFDKLEYISSAGLRVLLITQKKMHGEGKLIIRKVSESVKDVLDITGFSDILNIEE